MSSDDTRTDNKIINDTRERIGELRELLEDGIIYDIATALRGPDLRDDIIKRNLTGRIRYFVFGPNSYDRGIVEPFVFTETNAVAVIDEIMQLIEEGVFNNSRVISGFIHYLSHLTNAITGLQISGAMDEHEAGFMYKFVFNIRYILEYDNKLEAKIELKKLKKKYEGEEDES